VLNFCFCLRIGKKFDNVLARKYSQKFKDIVIVCGNYEGIDARVKKVFKMQEVSIGDYVLTGGALPAMILIDVISRQVKGVLGKEESLEENRISSSEVYTRPEVIKYKNKNIAQILDMTVFEALNFFKAHTRIHKN